MLIGVDQSETAVSRKSEQVTPSPVGRRGSTGPGASYFSPDAPASHRLPYSPAASSDFCCFRPLGLDISAEKLGPESAAHPWHWFPARLLASMQTHVAYPACC